MLEPKQHFIDTFIATLLASVAASNYKTEGHFLSASVEQVREARRLAHNAWNEYYYHRD